MPIIKNLSSIISYNNNCINNTYSFNEYENKNIFENVINKCYDEKIINNSIDYFVTNIFNHISNRFDKRNIHHYLIDESDYKNFIKYYNNGYYNILSSFISYFNYLDIFFKNNNYQCIKLNYLHFKYEHNYKNHFEYVSYKYVIDKFLKYKNDYNIFYDNMFKTLKSIIDELKKLLYELNNIHINFIKEKSNKEKKENEEIKINEEDNENKDKKIIISEELLKKIIEINEKLLEENNNIKKEHEKIIEKNNLPKAIKRKRTSTEDNISYSFKDLNIYRQCIEIDKPYISKSHPINSCYKLEANINNYIKTGKIDKSDYTKFIGKNKFDNIDEIKLFFIKNNNNEIKKFIGYNEDYNYIHTFICNKIFDLKKYEQIYNNYNNDIFKIKKLNCLEFNYCIITIKPKIKINSKQNNKKEISKINKNILINIVDELLKILNCNRNELFYVNQNLLLTISNIKNDNIKKKKLNN